MGGEESRCWFPACTQTQKETLTHQPEGETLLKEVNDRNSPEEKKEEEEVLSSDLPPVSKLILDLAQKMSEEVVAAALQVCWETNIQIKDFPFMDTEAEYVI